MDNVSYCCFLILFFFFFSGCFSLLITKPGIETAMHLKLAINRLNLDVGCDQGYGSERSPEDEHPPILSIPYQSIDPKQQQHQHHQKSQRNNGTINESHFNFITKGSLKQIHLSILLLLFVLWQIVQIITIHFTNSMQFAK